jgi:putative flippase GtrA
MTRQFVKFLVAGGIAAAANFGSRIILSHWLQYVVAIIIAYCIGMVTAFALNRAFVFKQPARSLKHQMSWFILVNLAALLQTIAFSVLLADYVFPMLNIFKHAEMIAHAFGIIIPVVTSYLGHKHFSFSTKQDIAN